ncbi:MAG: hypothetical protein FJW19_02885 [Actinobacteria bacterium]|nr:hypothetical protein [Actinomycetota bacterium]
MTRVVAVVQARIGSARFPGKMLENLGSANLLTWVLTRVSTAKRVDEVVLATSTSAQDDAIVELARSLGTTVFRGSETDVLDRFVKASHAAKADLVVRVCADNPFVAGEELDRLVDSHVSGQFDYSCNHQQRLNNRYVDGLGAEILSTGLLEKISGLAYQRSHREHVTSYIWDNPKDFAINAVQAPAELAYPEVKLDIDTIEDLALLNEFVAKFAITPRSSAVEVVRSYNKFR